MNFHYSWPSVTGLFAPEEARRSITVAHSGDGGDEIFGGYPKYAMLARRAAVDRGLTRPLTQLVAAGAGGMLPASSALRGRLGRYRLGYDELVLSTLVTGSDPHELRTVARGQLAKALRDYDPRDSVRPHLAKAPPAEVGVVGSSPRIPLPSNFSSKAALCLLYSTCLCFSTP